MYTLFRTNAHMLDFEWPGNEQFTKKHFVLLYARILLLNPLS